MRHFDKDLDIPEWVWQEILHSATTHTVCNYDKKNNYIAHVAEDFSIPESFIAIDFETATADRMACQLGVVFVNAGVITDRKIFLIQPPENKYDENTIRVHRIDPSETVSSPTFDKIWAELKPQFRGQTIVCHNAEFDIDVLYRNIDYYGLTGTHFKTACTCRLLGRATLYSACQYFNIELPNHHDALSDAEACAKLFIECGKYAGETLTIPKLKEPDRRRLSSDVKKQDLGHCVNKDTVFYNKKVVITGVFDSFPVREELANKLKELGADVNGSISRRTNIVIVGKSAGPKKLEQIEKLNSSGEANIQIMCEKELCVQLKR